MLEATASGGTITAMTATARSELTEGSRLCMEETIASLSVGVDLQEKLGWSQGNMSAIEFVCEQSPNVAAIAVFGAAMLQQKAPSKYRSTKLKIIDFVDLRFINVN